MSYGEGSARAPASELRSSTSSGVREPPWVISSSVGLQPGEWRRLRCGMESFAHLCRTRRA
eukprot:951635-Alexandrium_andersonii.AAC.1